MLGLIGKRSGMAAEVLESLVVTLEAAWGLAEEILRRGEQAPSGQLGTLRLSSRGPVPHG
jgi:hypothetical protein